ncbi:acyl-CoA dehydrogenase family protein [uncultured Endozoicomonas sp.]|uniref:acyl-CoA dehydrogenase family protein n=1 Tax=uncultured Endozoicomonas sp. TaxID=432652 RepID=UPI0026298C2D|nr:acyl-CoA dehydrogenase family protein [uncultured Endozoicomonas sp.]
MDFSLNDDQRAIADMATSLFSDSGSDEALIAFDESGKTTMDDLWQSCIETGLHALYLPEQFGGSELGMTELMLVLEAQGAALGQVPLWRHQIAAAAIAKFGNETLYPLVHSAASAELLLTLSQADQSRARDVTVKADTTPDGYLLNGRVEGLPEGNSTNIAIISIETADGIIPTVLDLSTTGIQKVEGVFTQGEGIADLALDNVIIPRTHALSVEALEWLEVHSIAAQASIQLGVSSQQIKRTVEYINERVQFGRPIAQFQAVQMTMADCHIALEALRSSLWHLCYRLDAGLPAQSEALAVAWQACEAGHSIGHKAQHVHGGFGVDITYPIHRFLYWSRALSLGLGGSRAVLEKLGDWLAINDKLGWKYDLDENTTV